MIVTIKSVTTSRDYRLAVTMTNGSKLEVDIAPYLDTVQFLPLKDQSVWNSVEVFDTRLLWQGKIELSIDTLLGMLKEGRQFGQASSIIKDASAGDCRMLRLQLDNGCLIEINMQDLLDCPPFAPLAQRTLWKTMQLKEHSLLWENQDIHIEIQMDMLLQYFA